MPVQLRGVVGHREEDPKQLAVGDFGRIIDDFHRPRMTGVAGADQYVFRSLGGAPGVSRRCADHALQVLEHGLNPQKQPPATTAVCSALLAAIGASTTGLGRVMFARSPALQAVAPANANVKIIAKKREKKLDITNPWSSPIDTIRRPVSLESATRQKLQPSDPILSGTT